MAQPRIYLSYAERHAAQRAAEGDMSLLDRYEKLSAMVQQMGALLVGRGEKGVDTLPESLESIRESDGVIMELGIPSFRVGAELALAQTYGRPLLVLCEVSRPIEPVLGELLQRPELNASVVRYEQLDDVAYAVRQFVTGLPASR